MSGKKPPLGINVAYLNYLNAGVLVLSTLLFVIPLSYPSNDPFDVLILLGIMALIISYSITAAAYYRQLFTASPQKISMLTPKRGISTITISPYILDKRKISVFVNFITFSLSPNYIVSNASLDGNILDVERGKNGLYIAKVDQMVTKASMFVVILEEQSVNITSRYVEFCLYYRKKEGSRILRFKESHPID